MTAHPHKPDSQFHLYPRDHSCPAIATKTTIPAAGATAPAAAKAAQELPGVPRRSSPSAGLPERVKATASGVPMPGSPTARSHLARSLIQVIESLMPVNATAMTVRRAGTLAMHRVRAATGRLPAVRHAVTMAKSVRSSRVKIVAVATSVRSSRAVTVRISIVTTVRRAGIATAIVGIARAALGIATMRVRRGVFPTGNLATGSPMLRAKGAARSGPIRRVAKVFEKTATVRVAIGRLAPGRHATAIAPVVIGLRESLAVTRSSRAARPIEDPARILVIVLIVVEIAATQNRGRSARIAVSETPVPPATAPAISTSRVLIARATTAAARI